MKIGGRRTRGDKRQRLENVAVSQGKPRIDDHHLKLERVKEERVSEKADISISDL